MKKLIIFVLIGIMVMVSVSSSCHGNNGVHNIGNKMIYTEYDFVNLKSGTPYDEVIEIYGEANDGWGNLVYPLEDGRKLHIYFSVMKQVLYINIVQGDQFERFYEWEEREKRETSESLCLRHPKSDFDAIEIGMSFDEVVDKLGPDYHLVGNGRLIARYFTEDFDGVLICCGQNNEVTSISFGSE